MRINRIFIGLGIVLLTTWTSFAQTAPAITSVSPESGAVGTAVTIKGANFSAIVAENTVYFGAVKALVNTASATELSVTVPSGATYMPISVTVAGLTAFASQPFVTTFSANQVIDFNSFGFNVDFSTGNTLYAIAIGDIDGDSYPDLVVTNSLVNSISIFRNTGTSGAISAASFATKVDFTTGLQPTKLSLGDLDGDGKLDIVVANRSESSVSVFKNTSTKGSITTSSLATKVDFTTGSSPNSVAIGDLDNDGKLDLVSSNTNNGGSLSILKNAGTAGIIDNKTFATKIDIALTNAWIVALGDLDVDGKLDLIATSLLSNSLSIFKNNTKVGVIEANSFAGKVDFKTGSGPSEIAIGDLNADEKPELVVANLNGSSVSVFENKGTSSGIDATSFTTKVDLSAPTGPGSVAIGDLNGDGKPDLAFTSSGNGNIQGTTVAVIRNMNTSGTITSTSFDNYYTFTAGTEPYSVAIGDLNGDQKPDLAVANASSKNISIVPSTISSPTPLPTITSFTPMGGTVGTNVTITGTNFNPVASSNIVKFNGTTAVVKSSTSTSISTSVPFGATTGTITVEVAKQIATSKDIFTVSAANPIMVSGQPLDLVRCLKDTASYKIAASGTNLKYQWQFQTSATNTFTDITNTLGYSGATSAVLRISNVASAMAGNYRCKLSADNAADVHSSVVILTISVPAVPTILTKNAEACASTFILQVQGFDKYKWTLANAITPDTLKVENQITTQQGQFLVLQTTVSNFKTGISKLYLTTKNTTGCTRLDSTTLNYFPNEKPVLSNGSIVGDSVLLIAQPIVRGNTSFSGTWNVQNGVATIKNPNTASTYAKFSTSDDYDFVYTVSNACSTNAMLSISHTANTVTEVANAGDDVYACADNAVLAAQKTTKAGSKGRWTLKKGTLKIENDTLFNSPITNINDSVSVLVWTVANTQASISSTDTMKVFRTKVQITEPGLSDTVFVATKTFMLNAKIEPFGSHVWYVNGVLQDNAPLRSNAGLPKDTSVFKIITNIVDCELADSIIVIFKDTKVTTNAGRDRNTCSDTATLAATTVPQGYAGVWRSNNPKIKFSDSTKVNTKVSELLIGQNQLFWLTKSGVTVFGRDTVIITSIAEPSSSIPNYMRACVPNETISLALKNNESISFASTGRATIRVSDIGINRFDVFNLARFPSKNEFKWTLSNGACNKTGQLTYFLSDTILIENKIKSGIAGDTIRVKVSDVSVQSLFSKTELYDSLIVEEIAGTKSNVVLKKYTVGDTMVYFVTNRKLISKETYLYRLRNSCGIISDTAILTVNTINKRPKPISRAIELVEGQNVYRFKFSLIELDSNRYLDTIRVLNAPIGVVTRILYPDSLSVVFEIDLTNAVPSSEIQSVQFRLSDTEGDAIFTIYIPSTNLGLEIYNAVSPNGDGKHDVFEIKGIEQEIYKNNKVEIFNRWGDRVYKQSGYNNKDIAFDGGTLPDGTYYYVLDLGNDRKLLSGFLLLSR